MFQVADLSRMNRITRRWLLTALLAAQAVIVAAILLDERAKRRVEEGQMRYNRKPGVWWKDNPAKPTILPPTVRAAEAALRPEEWVIGVQLAGKSRAYQVAAFTDESGHLVNDLIGGVPLSVAYCNITRCVRVYTDPHGSRPLDAEVTGLLDWRMVIRFGGNFYFHNTGIPVEPEKNPPPIPHDLLEPTVTTWQGWTQLHPETDVYVGGR